MTVGEESLRNLLNDGLTLIDTSTRVKDYMQETMYEKWQ